MKKLSALLTIFTCLTIVSCNNNEPTIEPTIEPTVEPTIEPTLEPTIEPTVEIGVGEKPRIRKNKDFIFEVDENVPPIVVSRYDFLANTIASDEEDGDLTDKITYEITNFYTNSKVSTIDLSTDGKYLIIYSVTDSNGNTTTSKNYIIVGDPAANLDENGNKKTFPNISDSEYELIKNSYELIFDQDYNYTGAPGTVEGESDYNGYFYQTGGGGWGNNEVQIYEQKDRTCYVSDGALKIQVIKEGNTYYSARLNTSEKISANWTYGIYEVTAKLPQGQGPWPAIWMMPNDYYHYGEWPLCGEIDIMETSNYYRNRIIGTIHTLSYNHNKGTQKSGGINDSTIYSEYHKYSIEWLPDRIKWYFDDQLYFTYKPASYLYNESQEVTVNEWPFNYSFHFIFNIAMGGGMGGSISDTLFDEYDEIAMYIDKVSVYQSTYVNEKYVK